MPNALAINMNFGEIVGAPDGLLVDMDFVPPPPPIDNTVGGNVNLSINGNIVICFKSFYVDNDLQLVDVTDSCSNGYRQLSFDSATRGVSINVEGVTKDNYIRTAAFANLLLDNVIISYPPTEGHYYGDVIFGSFVLSDYSESTPFDNVVTFSATMQSTGRIYYFPEVNKKTAFVIGDDENLSEILTLIYG